MSGITTATVVGIVSAVAAVGSGIATGVSASNAADAQKKAQAEAAAKAKQNALIADQNFNKANQKSPDTNAILAAAQQSGKSGGASTMLTGPQGVDPSKLTLGKTTLLGG